MLYDVLAKERQIRTMKKELMLHFLNVELPNKKPSYIPYSDAEWADFTSQKGIDHRDIGNWVDIAMASSVGTRWMTERNHGCHADVLGRTDGRTVGRWPRGRP
jgi:hypothetical protein